MVGTWDVSASGGAVAHALQELDPLLLSGSTFRYFVNIPGIPADATGVGYAGWIEASSFEFSILSLERYASSPALATTLNVVAPFGSASPLLLQSVANGVVFAAPIEIAASIDTKFGPIEVARWRLDQSRIAAYETASGLVDGFSIAFDALEYTVVDFLDDGTAQPVSATWDLAGGGATFAVNPIDLEAATISLPAVATFLHVPGVQGPSQTVGYVVWIPVDQFRFGVTRSLRSIPVPRRRRPASAS